MSPLTGHRVSFILHSIIFVEFGHFIGGDNNGIFWLEFFDLSQSSANSYPHTPIIKKRKKQ